MHIKIKGKLWLLTITLFFYLSTPTTILAFELGVTTHFNAYPNSPAFYLELMKNDGMNSLRVGYDWVYVEKVKGEYSVSEQLKKNDVALYSGIGKRDMSGMVVLGYGNSLYSQKRGDYPRTPEAIKAFSKYAYWTASRFKGKVKYYEVWNEWLYGTGNMVKPLDIPPPKIFYQLVKETSEAIKMADPNAIVLSGSFSPLNKMSKEWFDSLIDLGILNSIDGISLHPYGYLSTDRTYATPEGNLAGLDAYDRYIQKKVGKPVAMYITEIGVPNYTGKGGVGLNTSAQFVVKYTLLAKSRSYIKGVWWYDLINDGNSASKNEHNFGFYTSGLQPKPAIEALKDIAPLVTEYRFDKVEVLSDDRYVIRFSNGKHHAMIYWKKGKDNEYNYNVDSSVTINNLLKSVVKDDKRRDKSGSLIIRTSPSVEANDSDTPIMVNSERQLNEPWTK